MSWYCPGFEIALSRSGLGGLAPTVLIIVVISFQGTGCVRQPTLNTMGAPPLDVLKSKPLTL